MLKSLSRRKNMPKKLLSDMSDEEIRKDLKKKARKMDVQNA